MSLETLSPWDAMEWFNIPKETTFSFTGTPLLVAKADPQRVILLFGVPSGGAQITISTKANPTTNQGFILTTSALPLILTHKDHGPLVQAEWWMNAGGITFLTVIELMLRDYPRPPVDTRYD